MNPFKPTAGKNPPALIGRDHIVEEFAEGVENGPGAPNRLMRIEGARGMGKTVMLNAIAQQAAQLGWAVIDETASPGLCERVLESAGKLADTAGHVQRVTANPTVLGISLGSLEMERATLSLREALGKAARKNGNGVLITLDEVQDASLEEMRALAVAVQHVIRDDGSIAFVFAGLPSMVESVVNGRTLTFLRRAIPVKLAPLGHAEVAASYQTTFVASDVGIDAAACTRLADAADGHPFMVQLVGYHVWQAAQREGASTVLPEHVEHGTAIARERFDATVIEPALQRLPPSAIAYLLAMAQSDGATVESGQVAKRLGKTAQQASATRARLIKEDVIQACGWGKMSFAIPYLAEYLNEHGDELDAEGA